MKESLVRNVLTALISIVVTVIGGLLLYYFQTKDPEIKYTVEKILPFENQTEKLTIYHITIENEGSAVAEEIVCKIKLSPALVKEYRINSESPIQFTDSSAKDEIDVSTATLNPKESYRVSILATTNEVFPEEPNIKLRAKGISGMESEKPSGKKESSSMRWILSALALIASMATFVTLFTKRFLDDDVKHSADQNEVIAYLCGVHGLHNEAEWYININRKITYWSAMDRLATTAILKDDKEYVQKVVIIIKNLIEYAGMADSSVGIGYYNLARLYKTIDDEKECNTSLKEAQKRIPKLLLTRMKIDPIFKGYKIS